MRIMLDDCGYGVCALHDVSPRDRWLSASSSTRLGGSGRCSSRGGSGRTRRWRRGRWSSRRRWFPWRARSRVGGAEGVWRLRCGAVSSVDWLRSFSDREVCVCVIVSRFVWGQSGVEH